MSHFAFPFQTSSADQNNQNAYTHLKIRVLKQFIEISLKMAFQLMN